MADGFSMEEGVQSKSTCTIERTASGKVTRKLRTVQGDDLEVVKALVDIEFEGFVYLEQRVEDYEGGAQ